MQPIPVLSAQNLGLKRSKREIFHLESFTLNRGEVTALVGPNGVGKTSLLLTLALLQEPTVGTISIDGQSATKGNLLLLRRRMAVVFQEALLLDRTVMGNLTTALRIRGIGRRESVNKAERWLEQFGIASLAYQPARSLSGGEAQRASLARAFALEPELLFLDEPFAALDYPTRNALLNDLGVILKNKKMTTLFVTHDYSEIPYLAHRIAVMYQGRISKCGTIPEIFGSEVLERKAWAPWEE